MWRILCAMSFNVRRIEERSRRGGRWRRILLGALDFGRPLLRWYEFWKKRHEEETKKKRRVMALKRTLTLLVAVLCALVLLAGTVKALMSVRVFNLGTVASIAGEKLPADSGGFTNLVLIGQGNDNHDGKDLTDTIIVASMDPNHTKSVVLLSIPRDVYFLKTEKMGKGKINSFYRDYKSYLQHREGMEPKEASLEALRELGTEVGRNLGLEIHHAVKVNFTAFTEAVDALGGIDIEVPEDIVDTEYPDEQYGYETFEIRAGPQHLDGETALKYARSRSTTSDFSRSARQQLILRAIGQKAKDEGYLRDSGFITKMVQTLSKNVETTMSMREMIGLAELGGKIDRQHIVTIQLNDRNALYDGFVEPGGFLYDPPRNLFGGASVMLPVSIPEFPVTWRQPQTFVKLLLNGRAAYLANPRINILNNGAVSGSARKLATELIRYGFTVDEIANATLPAEQEEPIVFAAAEGQADLAMFFASLLQFQATEKPAALPANEVADITIILGKNYRYEPLQNLVPAS